MKFICHCSQFRLSYYPHRVNDFTQLLLVRE